MTELPGGDGMDPRLKGLAQGEPEAISALWQSYSQQLQYLARRKLGTLNRTVADSEDIALGVFASLCRGAAAGRFPELKDENDLWRILIAITRQKSTDLIRSELSQKKGGGKNVSFSVLEAGRNESTTSIDGSLFAADQLGPAELALLEDEFQTLMSLLPDDVCRQIVRLKLEMATVEEIAEAIDCAPRTVERRLKLIRKIWHKNNESD